MELIGRRYSIGIQNFEELRNRNCVYVDKTELVYKLVNTDKVYFCLLYTSGSMQGTFASFLTCSQCDEKKDTILFIDPGFPVQKQQLVVMGQK